MKPGYKTTEFWITIAVQLLNGLIQCGLLGEGTMLKAVSFASAALNALVYAIARAHVKSWDAGDSGDEAPTDATPAKAPEGGFVRIGLLAMLALVGLAIALPACSWLRSTGKEVAHAAVDCTKGAAADAVKQFAPLLENELAGTVDGEGQLDAAAAKSLTKGFLKETGGCVAAKAFAALLTPPKPDPAAPKSSPLYVDGRSARAVFEDLRREQFGGATFRLEDGTL
jgi:hypothetical protein